ncbi:envelope stress response membrane protein PspC [Motilimonas pumila]|uniref:Envelope stress response membrane protein PspC n=1 Tax=Motilimonas pumila TaxID=2303987 RepID=A0A418YCH4_9GAMM|nr:envelope stress response membrane protein PspC [Motilimonas pumila]RJG42162.1 envelope stress response membrane protein PspC [Motilimonas pumila]
MKQDKTLYRNPVRGKVAGVCAGLAEFFNMETWLVRIIVISVFLFNFPLAALAYGAACLLLDKKPPSQASEYAQAKGDIHLKSKVWQSGETPKQALTDLDRQFSRLEDSVKQMEKTVTSEAFQVNREINRL